MRRNYHWKLSWKSLKSRDIKECLHEAKEGDREGYRERVREIEGNSERDGD